MILISAIGRFIFLLITLSSLGGYCQNPTLPDCRASGMLIYHPKSQGLLLIDGYQIHLDSTRNDVWIWTGREWKHVMAYGPGTKSLSAGALNTTTGEVVVFGGIGNRNYETKRGDVWSFDGAHWKKIEVNNIGTRDHHKMVYASHLNAFVLYGGLNENRIYDSTTWILSGDRFEALNIPGPGMRYHFGMAYDKARRTVVLYGGGKGKQREELWEFDGKKWERVFQDKNPGARLRHSIVYDERQKLILLHGGNEDGVTWGWDGKAWSIVAKGGPVGDLIALGYDPVQAKVVAYGGSVNDSLSSTLWELENYSWKKVTENGMWQWRQGELVWIH